jgi:hypothetical protein
VAEWLGGIQGAPRAILLGAFVLMIILLSVLPAFWKRDLSVRKAA